MKFLIEGEKYPISLLTSIFEDPKFYHQDGTKGTILSVGYYHSCEHGEIVYMLPKVFMSNAEETIFGISKDDLLNFQTISFKYKDEFAWVRQISVYFYNSLLEYRRRNHQSNIIQTSLASNLNTNLNQQEYSYLDLLLSFVNFYKKNRRNILFRHIEFTSNQAKKPKWEKTVRKTLPLHINNQLIYPTHVNTKKTIDREEELLTYFFSILNHFDKGHNLHLNIDKSYNLISGQKFKLLQTNGMSQLKKIKYRYFNDTLKRMYHLCAIYLSKTDTSSTKKRKEEFISTSSYNLIFEDMIDKLFSDPIIEKKTSDGISLKSLKYNDDGKIVDHIFDHQSLLDTSNIFYIGDSKYYKSNKFAGKLSRYKQFTYAKNVIQYNIDLLNEQKQYAENVRYRDELTEGYNITPNFFIYGYIDDYKDFDDDRLIENGNIIKSFHFEERLFDRDTLFVHQYKINFLYVLKSYSQRHSDTIEIFRKNVKKKFRENFIDFFADKDKSKFTFYEYVEKDADEFVESNFKALIGKCFLTSENKLILAIHNNDKSQQDLLESFCIYELK